MVLIKLRSLHSIQNFNMLKSMISVSIGEAICCDHTVFLTIKAIPMEIPPVSKQRTNRIYLLRVLFS